MEAPSKEAANWCNGVSSVSHQLANEPSLGLYYVVEHIQRSVPALVSDKKELQRAAERLRGSDLDAGFALEDMTAATAGGTQRALTNVIHLATLAKPLAVAERLATERRTALLHRDGA